MSALAPGVPTIKDAEVLRLREDKAVDVNEMKDVLGLKLPRTEPRRLFRTAIAFTDRVS